MGNSIDLQRIYNHDGSNNTPLRTHSKVIEWFAVSRASGRYSSEQNSPDSQEMCLIMEEDEQWTNGCNLLVTDAKCCEESAEESEREKRMLVASGQLGMSTGAGDE